MRVLIVSDTHGSHRNLDAVLERVGKIDALIHMGDVENGEHYIEAVADCETYMVAGNNDFFSFLPKEREFTLGKYNIFITHGHNYYVSMGTARLKEEARLRKADIVMYGHTHKPDLEFDEDGAWIEIDCNKDSVPADIIPQKIYQYYKNKFAQYKIIKVEKEKKEYQIKLSSGLELIFNLKQEFLRFDD